MLLIQEMKEITDVKKNEEFKSKIMFKSHRHLSNLVLYMPRRLPKQVKLSNDV